MSFTTSGLTWVRSTHFCVDERGSFALVTNPFDPQHMIDRFKERAAAVKRRPLPPVAGEERQLFITQAQEDFQDFAMIGDAQATLEDGVLTLRIDLRPESAKS